MNRFLLCLLPALSLLLVACQPADEPAEPSPELTDVETHPEPDERAVPEVPSGAIDADRYDRNVATLSSDEFEGRAPGTRGERLTVNFLVEQFVEMGLQPGYGDSYLQPVPMVELTNRQRSTLDVTFDDDILELAYPDQMIINSRLLGEDEHGVSDSELVFVGYGVVAPEYDWNDYAGLDVEGKTVVILVNDPGYDSGDEAVFNGRAMTYYGRWTYKYEEAARQGAAAAIIVHETEPASYPWEVVINSWSTPEFVLAADSDEPKSVIEGWITVETAQELFARADLDFHDERERAGAGGFTPVSLGAKVSASVRNDVREGVSYNVLGLLPGSERPDEAIVYLAHWDHLGRNMAIPGSAGIYNGAIDNASGTAGLIEIASAFQQAGQPERSVLFLAVTLEEYGLLGSAHYVNDPVFPHEKTVAAINMDAMTLAGPMRDVVVVGYGSSELEEILAVAAEDQDRYIEPEPTPEAGFYYRSDHFNFARAGIPALYAKGGVDHREHGREYGEAWALDYRDNRYHKPADEHDPDWDLSGVIEDFELLYKVGRYLAGGDEWPNWYEGNEFRAIRDAQR
jgi:Zn-dependent M28 family amino/carboxypeptidase